MKKMKRIYLLMGLILPFALSAQTSGEIKGKVFDYSSGEPLIGANVYVEYGDQLIGAATDAEGRYTLKPLNPGVYNVHVSFMGYKEFTFAEVRVRSDNITVLKPINLAMDIAMFKSIPEIIVYKIPLIDPEETSKMSISSTILKNNPSLKNPVALISHTIPGVTQSKDGQGLHFRGSRTNAIAYYVDGVKQGDNFSPIPSTAINNITVYTGGLPARYGDVTGGVIVVETKSYFDLYNAWKVKEERLKYENQ